MNLQKSMGNSSCKFAVPHTGVTYRHYGVETIHNVLVCRWLRVLPQEVKDAAGPGCACCLFWPPADAAGRRPRETSHGLWQRMKRLPLVHYVNLAAKASLLSSSSLTTCSSSPSSPCSCPPSSSFACLFSDLAWGRQGTWPCRAEAHIWGHDRGPRNVQCEPLLTRSCWLISCPITPTHQLCFTLHACPCSLGPCPNPCPDPRYELSDSFPPYHPVL